MTITRRDLLAGSAAVTASSFMPRAFAAPLPRDAEVVVIGAGAAGIAAARRIAAHDDERAVLVHGDAAFAGQGVVMETLALAQTRYYYTGGTVHLVINNQIGFTTSDPRDTRSTLYCTDVVKMIEAPVLHVNGDDPEAVVWATQLCMDYRAEFRKDVVLDIVCFRKLGHNEQDTPALTQPPMYKKIAAHPGTRKLYGDKLVAQGVLQAEGPNSPDGMVKAYRAAMDEGRHTVDPVLTNFKSKYATDWSPFLGKKWTDNCDTAVPVASAISTSALAGNKVPGRAACQLPLGSCQNRALPARASAIMLNRAASNTSAKASRFMPVLHSRQGARSLRPPCRSSPLCPAASSAQSEPASADRSAAREGCLAGRATTCRA